eukprot:TRINITY_DN63211_c0_g1_i1.p1 TRINITY_DN63211_c0_g1~~TRINITY_DN63211_c0_g1_i1.p1  ORF type:complete len:258 (+),score=33.74 TRINITY_DN63211_c0_g1_i1:178-951(+)
MAPKVTPSPFRDILFAAHPKDKRPHKQAARNTDSNIIVPAAPHLSVGQTDESDGPAAGPTPNCTAEQLDSLLQRVDHLEKYVVALNDIVQAERVTKRTKGNSEIAAPCLGPNWAEIIASIESASSFEELQAGQSDGCFRFQDLKEGMKFAAARLQRPCGDKQPSTDPDEYDMNGVPSRWRALVFIVVGINKLVDPAEALPAIFEAPADLLALTQHITQVSQEMVSKTSCKIVLDRGDVNTCVNTLFAVTRASMIPKQ